MCRLSLVLAARNGVIFDYTINYPGLVAIPHTAYPEKPVETNAPVAVVAVPPVSLLPRPPRRWARSITVGKTKVVHAAAPPPPRQLPCCATASAGHSCSLRFRPSQRARPIAPASARCRRRCRPPLSPLVASSASSAPVPVCQRHSDRRRPQPQPAPPPVWRRKFRSHH